jgi:hypothetical protein
MTEKTKNERLLDVPLIKNPRVIYTDIGLKWPEVEARIKEAEKKRYGPLIRGDINTDQEARMYWEEMKVMKPVIEQIASQNELYAIIAPRVRLCCHGDRPGGYLLIHSAGKENIKLLVGDACANLREVASEDYWMYTGEVRNHRRIEFGNFDKLKVKPEMTLRELLRQKAEFEKPYLEEQTFEERIKELEGLFK